MPIGSALAILSISSLLSNTRLGGIMTLLSSATLFVYATHEPCQTILAKLWNAFALPLYGTQASFFLIPLLVYGICVNAYFVVRRFAAPLLVKITGGR